MAISDVSSECEAALILESQNALVEDEDDDQVLCEGYQNYKGYPLQRSKSGGGWTSAAFMLGAGSLERFVYNGIESNIINYFIGYLGESMARAAAIANAWMGLNWIMPIFGALLADSFLGKAPTVILTSILYILGLGSLSLLTFLVVNFEGITNATAASGASTELKALIFISLSLVSIAQGFKPCVQAFGADQFDGKTAKEKRSKSSFFNWWFCVLSAGGVASHLILHYIQDNIGWVLGFGIPCLTMLVGLTIFLIGIPTYRFPIKTTQKSVNGTTSIKIKKYSKVVVKLIPIWITCLSYGIAFAQASTFFTKQGNTMDKSLGKHFVLPAASIRTFLPLTIVIFTPIYDRVIIPIARIITKNPSGLTMLQRICTGMVLCFVTMIVAALTEMKRREVAKEHGLIDVPNAIVPMSFWWLVPQYVMFGMADNFALVGMQEFFYDQVPSEIKSVGLSFYTSVIGVGSFCSSIIISLIQESSGGNGKVGWLDNNLNQAHLDYFYWLLAGIVGVGLTAFVIIARTYNLDETCDKNDDIS